MRRLKVKSVTQFADKLAGLVEVSAAKGVAVVEQEFRAGYVDRREGNGPAFTRVSR